MASETRNEGGGALTAVSTRLVQFAGDQARRVGIVVEDAAALRVLDGYETVYQLAQAALRAGTSLESVMRASASDELVDYDALLAEHRVLVPLDHPDPARCTVSVTGLTHLGSAASRDEMHRATAAGEAPTDSLRMFQAGLAGGRPAPGAIGIQPEWAYKGDGRCVVAPGEPLLQPAFAEDGGEEAEIAGVYVIDDRGAPRRVGFAIGNEFADHILEAQNYLYLAHSKLRPCSLGPELVVGDVPPSVEGTVRILRGGDPAWSGPFASGEANMCHSFGNLEHHLFKNELFRRPGDIHIHFFGANGVSFGDGFRSRDGDVFEIDVPVFGRPLRNPLTVAPVDGLVEVAPL